MMAGSPFTTPTAAHVIAVEHDTLERASVPEGAVWELQLVPSVVLEILMPSTAVHSSIVKHEIDSAGNVESSTLHVAPPSLDLMIPWPPPA
jgi:hypothetical protein